MVLIVILFFKTVNIVTENIQITHKISIINIAELALSI